MEIEKMNIRQEQPEDYSTIYEVVKEAFKTARVKDGTEQEYVNKLRAGSGYIPEFALVAEENGKIIGHIMLTRIEITTANGICEALLLSPLCVLLESRSKGVGGALIRESFRLAKNKGYKAVFLCGDPGYYNQFGFTASEDYGIKNIGDIPAQYVLAAELISGALSGIKGTIKIE